MSYYHVLASFEASPTDVRCVLSDLTEQELLDRFVRHYRAGRDAVIGNEVVPISRARKIYIVRTEEPEEVVRSRINRKDLERIDRFNASSDSVVLISPGRGYGAEDILAEGLDVTPNFIVGAPGYAQEIETVAVHSRWRIASAVVNHPWVVGVGASLLAAGLLALAL